MRRIYCSLVFTLILLLQSHHGDADCLFPNYLTGDWHSSAKGPLNISSSSTTTSISSYSTSKFGTVSLYCYLSSGKKFVFRSPTFNYLSLDFEVYVCFVLSKKLSARKNIYYLGSDINNDANDERLKSEVVSHGVTHSIDTVCDRTSYDAGTEHIFLKNDGKELNSRIRFPYDFRGKWVYNFTSSGVSSCTSESSVDVCLNENAKTMQYNYTACATIQAYSATGVLKCMYYTSDSVHTYVHVYNTDTTTDESTTYRFTCYVIYSTSTTLYATQYPQECSPSQNATQVSPPGALLVYTRTESCPYDTSSTVISTASATGVTVILLLLIVGSICGVLIWRYHQKRLQQELDRLPLQKPQPANTRLVNGDLYRDGGKRIQRPPRAMNGDVKLNLEADPEIRRENSIHISMTSRGGSGFGGLDGGDRKHGVAPVEEPEVNYISDDVIIESENEAALASTFLPITPDERNVLHFTDEEIKAIERKSTQQLEDKDDEFDMDDVDDELGLPRLSRAFTPILQPEEPPPSLPTIAYKKTVETDTQSEEEVRADGIKKVKLKKKFRKKRVKSTKGNIKGVRPKSILNKTDTIRETPFLERLKIQDAEIAAQAHRDKIINEMKEIENEVIKARLAKNAKASRASPSSKYMVDGKGSKNIQQSDKRPPTAPTPAGERRRFGDPPTENTRKNRKRTPRIRHPMEVQGDSEEIPEQKEVLKKADDFWKDEKKARSGRRREHPEALTIPSLKEDPFDHRDEHNPPATPAFSQARSGKSAFGMRTERECSFIDPVIETGSEDKVWERASHMWHNNRSIWNNLAHP